MGIKVSGASAEAPETFSPWAPVCFKLNMIHVPSIVNHAGASNQAKQVLALFFDEGGDLNPP